MVKPPLPKKPSRSDDAVARADVALRMGQMREAEQIATQVLKADKGHLGASFILARSLLGQGRRDDAIPILERAARRHDEPTIKTLLAATLAASGRADDAIAQLAAMTRANVAFGPAYREEAALLVTLGRIDEARGVLTRGIAVCSDAIDLRLDLASLHLRQNDRAAAREVLTHAWNAAPGRADVLSELARVLMLEGDYAQAADVCRHALALQPDNAMTRANLAACQLELGARSQGEATLRAAVQGRPHMIGRAIHALAASSHGRFFIKPADVARFLKGERV